MANVSNDMNLLPCAHCGSDGVHLVRTVEHSVVRWYVECVDCGIRTLPYEETYVPSPIEHGSVCHAMDDAIVCAVEAWNTRPNTMHERVSNAKALYITAHSIANQMNRFCNKLSDELTKD